MKYDRIGTFQTPSKESGRWLHIINAPASADYLRSLSRAAVDRRLLIFAGAGMSMLPPSRSPSWWEIFVGAAQALADRFKEGFPELASQVELDALLKPLATRAARRI